MKQTPTPWKVEGEREEFIVGSDGHTVAKIVNPSPRRKDAAFIVRAVNSYNLLKRALLRVCQALMRRGDKQ